MRSPAEGTSLPCMAGRVRCSFLAIFSTNKTYFWTEIDPYYRTRTDRVAPLTNAVLLDKYPDLFG